MATGPWSFVASYVQACASGAVRISDCGPVWQLGIIAALLLVSIFVLATMRLRVSRQAREQ
jgi:hypothetical protein